MRLLADEGVDGPIVERLRDLGHDVAYIAEMDPGISDDEVLTQAVEVSALLLTPDKDFGELVFRMGRMSSGVLLLRLSGLSIVKKAEAVARVLDSHGREMRGAFTVLSPGGLRIRK